MSDRLQNWQENIARLAAIEPAARQQLAEDLGTLGELALELQMAGAPSRTGFLRNNLTIAQSVATLRVRVGYPDLKGGKDKRFYAVFQESGVAAGSKLVQRRRRVNGKLRLLRGRKRPEDIVMSRTITWKARPGRPFVHIEGKMSGLLADVQDSFWAKALGRAGDAA